MVQTPTKSITLEVFLQQPDTKPASEYIDGRIIQKPMPKAVHSVIQGELSAAINAVLKPIKVARAFPELRCTFAGSSVVPDITVVPWANIPRQEDGMIAAEELPIAPPWAIEVLSPGQNQTTVTKKILRGLEHGTQMGWLIDPAEKCVFSYTADLPTAFYEEATQQLPVPAFAADFSLTLGTLVGWLYE